MSGPALERRFDVMIAHRPEHHLVQASFVWPEDIPSENTYTTRIGWNTSFKLDRFIPVRPVGLRVNEAGLKSIKQRLAPYIGHDITAAMVQSVDEGPLMFTSTLTADNRLHLAQMQLHNPSTPPELQEACQAMIDALGQPAA